MTLFEAVEYFGADVAHVIDFASFEIVRNPEIRERLNAVGICTMNHNGIFDPEPGIELNVWGCVVEPAKLVRRLPALESCKDVLYLLELQPPFDSSEEASSSVPARVAESLPALDEAEEVATGLPDLDDAEEHADSLPDLDEAVLAEEPGSLREIARGAVRGLSFDGERTIGEAFKDMNSCVYTGESKWRNAAVRQKLRGMGIGTHLIDPDSDLPSDVHGLVFSPDSLLESFPALKSSKRVLEGLCF